MYKNWMESRLFSYDEAYKLRNSENFDVKTVIYCSYENRFAQAGGLGSVATVIVPYLNSYSKTVQAILITPFHKNVMTDSNKSKLKVVGNFPIHFYEAFGMEEQVTVYSYTYTDDNNLSTNEYFLYSDKFFNDQIYGWNLLDDAMFFSKCIPRVAGYLEALGEIKDNIVFHLNDWHTSLATLTIKESVLVNNVKHARSVITLHNMFDENPTDKIWRISKRNYNLLKTQSPLQIGLELCSGPPSTVSENYAKEIFYDPLQTKIMGAGIQDVLKRKGIVGINNGPFCSINKIYDNYDDKTQNDIKVIKESSRKSLICELKKDYTDKLGSLSFKNIDASPIFFMYGRLDTIQKGFDFLVRAFKIFREKNGFGKAKLLITPISSDNNLLLELYNMCPDSDGDFAVYRGRVPFFDKILAGATFGVFPSMYEPFGGALEMICNGTPVIARSTGGLVDQLPDKYRFREPSIHYNKENLVYHFNTKDNISGRHNLLSDDIVWALYNKLNDFYNLYKNHRNQYYNSIKENFSLLSNFSWEKAASEYFERYNER